MKFINLKLGILVITILLVIACTKDAYEAPIDVEPTTTKTQSETTYNFLSDLPESYQNYFLNTENSIGFTALKQNSLSQYSIVRKLHLSGSNPISSLQINDETYRVPLKGLTSVVKNDDAKNSYGKEFYFKLNKKHFKAGFFTSTASTTTTDEVSMYVPELVNITNPNIETEEQLFLPCYYDGFVLEWNADSNNTEGLVVVAEYSGNNVVPSNDSPQSIINIDHIEEDDGHTILDSSLFKDIPNLSFVNLILLRGNVTIEEIEGQDYKFFAESHQRLPFVLVRDLNTVVKEE